MATRRDDATPVRLVRAEASWGRRYREVASELAGVLGDALRSPEGRLLEVHHVGSTAVPGLATKPTLDVMARLAAWPLEADPEPLAALRDLGYVDHGEHGLPGRRFLTRDGHEVHLHLLDPSGARLRPHLAFRDLLLDDVAARDRYAAVKRRAVEAHGGARAAYVAAKAETVRRLTERASRRAPARTGFAPVVDLVRRVAEAGLDVDRAGGWALGGGWALDLATGRVTRGHDDVDVVLDRAEAAAWLAAISGREVAFRTRRGPWRPGDALPRHPARLDARAGPLVAPSPAWEAPASAPVFWDVVLEPRRAGAWLLRTDPAVTLPAERAVLVHAVPGVSPPRTVPSLAPEVALLCKAKLSGRGGEDAKDRADLEAALPILDDAARAWLRAALARPPAHAWAERWPV